MNVSSEYYIHPSALLACMQVALRTLTYFWRGGETRTKFIYFLDFWTTHYLVWMRYTLINNDLSSDYLHRLLVSTNQLIIPSFLCIILNQMSCQWGFKSYMKLLNLQVFYSSSWSSNISICSTYISSNQLYVPLLYY